MNKLSTELSMDSSSLKQWENSHGLEWHQNYRNKSGNFFSSLDLLDRFGNVTVGIDMESKNLLYSCCLRKTIILIM